jgi:hypothetical protein
MKPRDTAAFILVLLASFGRQILALRAPFFADDYLFLEQARGRSLFRALSSHDPIGNFLRPVSRQLYFWSLTRLGGDSPAFFHAVNMGLFLILLGLLFGLVRRLSGARAAVIATSFVGLHYAADVPVLWVSGSQDLLAIGLGLAAIWLYLSGRRAWGALAFLLALLSKETVCLIPFIALLADKRKDEPWLVAAKRSWLLFAVVGGWAIAWAVTVRLPSGDATDLSPAMVPSVLVHLLQVVAGLEFRVGELRALVTPAIWIPLLAVMLAAGLSALAPRRADSGAIRIGVAWALLGALPVAAVAPIWSAYFYLFALCGVGLAIGAWVQRAPTWQALFVVGVLALTSENASRLDEFATAKGIWTPISHVNRFYLERGMARVTRFLSELKRARPALPSGSTVFFANVPPSTGWQAADGPLLRWAYRDTSLRSYYLTEFAADKVRRGPLFFFAVEMDTLRDKSMDPDLLRSLAYSLILARKPGPAADALTIQIEQHPEDEESRYWRAWMQWSLGNHEQARTSLAAIGISADKGPAPELALANAAISRGDTAKATQILISGRNSHCLDVELHSRLAALWLPHDHLRPTGVIEAYIVTILSPDRADGWRKFASGQIAEAKYAEAVGSLRRYFALGGSTAAHDTEAQQTMATLVRMIPGGDLAQSDLRHDYEADTTGSTGTAR